MQVLTFQDSQNLLFCFGIILQTIKSEHLSLDIHNLTVLQAVN